MNRKIEIAFAITIIMLVGSVMVPAMMQKPIGSGPYKAMPSITYNTNWVTGKNTFILNSTTGMTQTVLASSTNPAFVNLSNDNTKYYVNGTTNTPITTGYYNMSLGLVAPYLNMSFGVGGSVSYSYDGVYVENVIYINGVEYFYTQSYISSSKSTISINGTVYSNNYAMPDIYVNYTGSSIVVYLSASGGNGAYFFKHSYAVSPGQSFSFKTYDYGDTGGTSQYDGWSVGFSQTGSMGFNGIEITANGLYSVGSWAFNFNGNAYTEPVSVSTVTLLNVASSGTVQGLVSKYYSPVETGAIPYTLVNNLASITLSYAFNSNQTSYYEFTLTNQGPTFSNGYIPFTFTNESLFAFNITNNIVQNVRFLYSNGTEIHGFIPTGQTGLGNTNQGSGKWLVYLSNLSMLAGSTENIYMQVYPNVISVLNANFSSANNEAVGLNDIAFNNPALIDVHYNDGSSYSTTTTSLTFTAKTSGPGTQYLNLSVNGTTNKVIDYAVSIAPGWAHSGSNYVTGSEYTGIGDYQTGLSTGAGPDNSILGSDYYYQFKNYTGIYTGSSTTTSPLGITGYYNGSYLYSVVPGGSINYSLSSFTLGLNVSAYWGSTGGSTSVNVASSTVVSNLMEWNMPESATITAIGPVSSKGNTGNSGNYVLFNETGVPYNQKWTVNVVNTSAFVNQAYSSTTNTLKAFLPTGHNYSFVFTTANQEYYNIVNETGHVFLSSSSNASVNITLTNVSYFVNFKESGLLAGSSWTITLNGSSVSSTNNEISYLMRNGSYAWSVSVSSLYDVTPSSGTITVSGSAQTVNVVFTYKAFNITFGETGLPTGQAWSLTIAGTVYNSVNGTVLFQGKTGSYSATINNASYYTPVNKYFNFSISGNAHYTIQYAVLVTFTETGYQGSWTISVNGQSYTSTTNTIVVKITPGYFTYYVTGISGYSISPIHNSNYYFTPQTIKIAFSKTTAPIWSIFVQPDIIALIVIVGVITGMWLVFRKK